jgi:hypothetical protein
VSALSTLCVHCGLCCDGTLFTHVPLRRQEVEGLERLGLRVAERTDGVPVLLQPCAALKERCCTVYADRPKGCRRYQCYLLTALAEGEVSLEEAHAVVDEAHALRASGDRERTEHYLDKHFRGRHQRPGKG